MDDVGQYQGSEAFSHIVPQANESINPNTGSLNYKVPLVQLRGIRQDIKLSLAMIYNWGTVGTFGLPTGWSLDLPYVLNGKSLSANGRTYVIDSEWSDDTGYASGLRYINNHGIKFQQIEPPLDLPSGLPGQYGFQLDMIGGSIDYFDVYGKPLEHHDVYGSFIYYAYQPSADGGVESPGAFLDYIQDSWGQIIQLQCDSYDWTIELPDGNSTSLALSDQGLQSLTNPAQLTTTFEYVDFGGNTQALSIITYPTGLISRYDYDTIQYLDRDSNARNMPAIQNHYHLDEDYTSYSRTEYRFGGFSGGNTYTGAAIGLVMDGGTDQLVDGNGEALTYEYDVVQTSYDKDDNEIARTCTWYSNYHLPIREIRYKLVDGDFAEAIQTEYEYDIPVEKQARTTSYNYPVSTSVSQNTLSYGEPSYLPLSRSSAKYNDFGMQISSSQELYVSGSGYIKQTTTKNEYATGANGIQLLVKSTHRDEVSQTEDQTQSVLTKDAKNLASTTIYFSDANDSQHRPWTKRSFGYDKSGRITSETTAWADGAEVPSESVTSSTNTVAYSFGGGVLTQAGTDADGNITTIKYDMRMSGGPMIKKILPRGQTESFEYDSISRLTKHTNALGHETNITYTIGPNGGSQQVTSPLGYVKLTKSDILGREASVLDNGDPTTPITTKPSRLLSTKKYDFRSRVRETTDYLGLIKTSTYDALDRPLQIVDSRQNILGHQYDDATLKVTQTLNGEIRAVTQLNGRFDEIAVVTHPDSSDTTTNYYVTEDSNYDGNRRIISKIVSETPKNGGDAKTLRNTATEYGPDSAVISNTVTGYSAEGQDTVRRQFTVDLFGNTYTWTKTTNYADNRNVAYNGPIRIFDKNNRLILTRNQLGQEERSSYDSNGWLTKVVRYDKSEIDYICDDVGQFIKEIYPQSTSEFTFNAEGRLTSITDGAEVINYETSLDGTLTKVIYKDGKSQSFSLDKYSRTKKETDVFGVDREISYTDTGDISKMSCNGDTMMYQYGSANHINGQCLGFSLNGGRSYISSLSYDGFGRIRQATVKDSQQQLLLDTSYIIDSTGKVQYLKTNSSLQPELNDERILAYDGLGQVTSDVRSSNGSSVTNYTYDGNSNVKSKEINGQTTNMTYNSIDQRTDAGFRYDTNGRMTKDNQGNSYYFDDRDRLTFAITDGKTADFGYHADGYLGYHQSNNEGAQLYYNCSKINAVEVNGGGKNNTSLFSNGSSLVASYSEKKGSNYFLDNLGSTALVMGDNDDVPMSYEAYGSSKNSPDLELPQRFGFGQELFEPIFNLLYLRTRLYSQKHMSFLSMDRYSLENRYAYCGGDPINNVDPLGLLDWKIWLAIGVGAVVAGIVTFGVGFAVEAALGAVGVGAVGAAIAAGAIGGAVGNVAGGAVSTAILGQKYTLKQGVIDATVGAIGGFAGAAVTPIAEGATATIRFGGSALSKMTQKTITSGISGAVNNTTQATLRPVLQGQPIDPLKVAESTTTGFIFGAAGGNIGFRAKAQWEALSPRAFAAARQFMGRIRGRTGVYNVQEVEAMFANYPDMMDLPDLANDLPVFTSGRYTGLDMNMSEASAMLIRPRTISLGALGGSQEENPVEIVRL